MTLRPNSFDERETIHEFTVVVNPLPGQDQAVDLKKKCPEPLHSPALLSTGVG